MADEKLTIAQLWARMTEISLDGWISHGEGEWLREVAEKMMPGENYLEIGVAYGKSLSTMCYYKPDGVNVFGIDRLNWSQRDENMGKLGVGGMANFIEGDSQVESFTWDKPLDVLFIDADHSYYGVIKDICSWVPHLKRGGLLMFHDYDKTSPGVMKAIHDFIYPHPAYTDFGTHETIYHCRKI